MTQKIQCKHGHTMAIQTIAKPVQRRLSTSRQGRGRGLMFQFLWLTMVPMVSSSHAPERFGQRDVVPPSPPRAIPINCTAPTQWRHGTVTSASDCCGLALLAAAGGNPLVLGDGAWSEKGLGFPFLSVVADFVPLGGFEEPIPNFLWIGFLGLLGIFISESSRPPSFHFGRGVRKPKCRMKAKPPFRSKNFTLCKLLGARPCAYACRKCGNRRLVRARMKHRRKARRIASRWLHWRKPQLLRYSRNKNQLALFSPDPVNCCLPNDDPYSQWLRNNCEFLAGGAAGSARTRRKRQESHSNQNGINSLIQAFKQLLNTSGQMDLSPLVNLINQHSSKPSKPKKLRKKRYTAPSPSPTQKPKQDPPAAVQTWNGHKYRVCPTTGWWTWVGPEPQKNPTWVSVAQKNIPAGTRKVHLRASKGSYSAKPSGFPGSPGLDFSARRNRPISGFRVQDWARESPPK